MGRLCRYTETGGFLVTDTVRQRYRQFGRKRDVLGRRAVGAAVLRIVEPYALADADACHTLSHRFDGAGAIAMRNDARVLKPTAEPTGTLLGVGWVDARGSHPHQHLPRRRAWRLSIAYDQYIGCGSEIFVPGCAHSMVLPLVCVRHCHVNWKYCYLR